MKCYQKLVQLHLSCCTIPRLFFKSNCPVLRLPPKSNYSSAKCLLSEALESKRLFGVKKREDCQRKCRPGLLVGSPMPSPSFLNPLSLSLSLIRSFSFLLQFLFVIHKCFALQADILKKMSKITLKELFHFFGQSWFLSLLNCEGTLNYSLLGSHALVLSC